MKNAVRPTAFSCAFLLASTLVPGAAAFAQGGMWRPDPALGAAPMTETGTFRPGAYGFQARTVQPRMRDSYVPAAPRYRAAADRIPSARPPLAAPAPVWRGLDHQRRATPYPAPAQAASYPWGAPPMHAAMPWSAPLPPAAAAHTGYAAYAVPPMPVWGGMQAVQWQPALAHQGYPYAQRPATYQSAPTQPAGQWSAPAPAMMAPRSVSGGWRPDPLAAAAHYRTPASAYTSPRNPVFRGAPVIARNFVQARPMPRPLAAPGYWRPDTAAAWASSQAFRPVAYGRSIALAEPSKRTVAQGAQSSHGDLPGWATTVDRFEETGSCAWCNSGT